MIWTLFLMAAEPAVDCANAMTQADMNICSYRDFQSADRDLNAAWGSAAIAARDADKHGPSGAFDRLLDSQRKWLAYRDAQCLSENGPREQSGTIWPLLQNGCLHELTQARTGQLRDYLKSSER
ncbi:MULTISPECIES: lysozyme inhibitor LprI family protein [unclassified Novosphingobium]|uniref:lysozyme inhibitor LprI family protein n=1 Tax=unclassified Novosphingobium TaxID=2644732 RepID=UPI001F3F494E|nr:MULTISPECIES: lysozyme inhibitor LprI family protein [unclassified Novosphingobium]